MSSKIIPVIHPLISDNRGENYWFNGCAAYAMECLGEPDYDYWFFAGLTGDNFTQFYPRKGNCCAASDYLMGPEYAQWVFDQIGYGCEYVTDPQNHMQKLIAHIDKGVPVTNCDWGVFVGYEDNGQTLLYLTHEDTEPARLKFAEQTGPWIFVGEKREQKDLARLYREAILRLPELLMTKTDDYVFGAQAFRDWAQDIESGKYDDPAMFDEIWWNYTNYVCALATNGSCCFSFLEKAKELNPDMVFLDEIAALYKKMGAMWGGDTPSRGCLEKLGGGFWVSYKTLGKPRKRAKIVAKLREFADCVDEVVRVTEKGTA